MTKSQLPFGWVCFSNRCNEVTEAVIDRSQLPFGWVCFSNTSQTLSQAVASGCLNCLSAGSVSLTADDLVEIARAGVQVSIAFRLGLFL